jgi:NTP pyrophosphatase (non-canonical NTP hydrolase)
LNIQETHEMIWEFRKKYSQYWATPDLHDSLMFALSEIGEAADAIMRMEDGYSRNNERQTNYLDELADTAIMLHTALGENCNIGQERYFSDLGTVAYHIGLALFTESFEPDVCRNSSINALENLYSLVPDLPERIASRLERIYEKHVEPQSRDDH